MNKFLFTVFICIIAGLIDVLPMIKMKLDKYSIGSAFVFYFVLTFVIINIDLFGLVWWLKGGITGFALALPIIIMVARDDKKAVPLMLMMSIILGSIIGTVDHFLSLRRKSILKQFV